MTASIPIRRDGGAPSIPASRKDDGDDLAASFLAWFLGCVAVYATLFATGYLLYGRREIGLACAAVAIASAYGLKRVIPKVA